jgi:hypothetical protein
MNPRERYRCKERDDTIFYFEISLNGVGLMLQIHTSLMGVVYLN